MPARSWDCAQVWSKAKLLGGHLGGLAPLQGGFHLLPEIQNWVFRAISLFSFLRVGGVGEIGPMKFPSLYRGKQGFQ